MRKAKLALIAVLLAALTLLLFSCIGMVKPKYKSYEEAYDYAKVLGYKGTLEDFVASLGGAKSKSIVEIKINEDGELIVRLRGGILKNLDKVGSGDDNPDGDNDEDPLPLDEDDLAEDPHVYSIATDNYGAQSTLSLQHDVAYDGNALETRIPDRSHYTTGYGSNHEVWSWICFPLDQIFDVQSIDLTHKYLTFYAKVSNAYLGLSFILVDESGVYSAERPVDLIDGNKTQFVYCESKEDGWYKVYIRFFGVGTETFGQRIYPAGSFFNQTKCKTIMLTTSNNSQNTLTDSYTYFDKVYLVDELEEDIDFNRVDIHLTNSNAATDFDVLIIGNSSIYTTNVGRVLQGIADQNGNPLYVKSYSKGNGTVSELYEMGWNRSRKN